MPSSTKALLVGLNVYLASNNVRRSIGSFVANVANLNSDVTQISTLVLANSGTYTYNATPGNLITVVSTSGGLVSDLTFAGGGGFTKTIASLLVIDTEVQSIVFTNTDTENNVELVIISG